MVARVLTAAGMESLRWGVDGHNDKQCWQGIGRLVATVFFWRKGYSREVAR